MNWKDLSVSHVYFHNYLAACDTSAIGLADVGKIPDSSFSASSQFGGTYAAQYGRLNNSRAWGSKDNVDVDDYLQIDLLYEYIICAVATQGNPKSNTNAQEWTTYYKISLSLNDTSFDTYKENNNVKVGLCEGREHN